MGAINQIINLGTNDVPKGEARLTRVVNKINLLTIGLSVVLAVINVSSGLWVQSLINVLCILLIFIPVYILNYRNRQWIARVLFVIGLTISVTGISIFNVLNGRQVNTEIIIFAVSSFIIIVFDGRTKVSLYLFTSLCLFQIEYLKGVYLLGGLSTDNFIFTLINYSVALIAVFYFSQIFKEELSRAANKANRLNEELERSRLILSSLIDNTPLFLAMLDARGCYVTVNKKYEDAFGLSKQGFVGKHYAEILSPEMAQFHEPLIDRCLGGEYLDFYQELPEKTNLYSHSYGKYFPVFDDKGNVQFITVFVTDITQLKKAEHQLKELNKAKDKLFSVLAHDIISPINLLKNTLHLSEHEQSIDEEDIRSFLKRAKGHLLVLSHMMENLLRWGKTQFHGWKSEPEEVSLVPLIQNILHLYQDHSSRKQLQVLFDSGTECDVTADKGHLELIVRNLIVNAFKFSEIKSDVKIEVESIQDGLEIRVTDKGCGIDEQLLQRIQEGSAVESEIGTDGESGTGLGLQMCFEVAQQEGWSLTASSGTKSGTTFSLLIPETSI